MPALSGQFQLRVSQYNVHAPGIYSPLFFLTIHLFTNVLVLPPSCILLILTLNLNFHDSALHTFLPNTAIPYLSLLLACTMWSAWHAMLHTKLQTLPLLV